jgi:hypothetical protein
MLLSMGTDHEYRRAYGSGIQWVGGYKSDPFKSIARRILWYGTTRVHRIHGI